MAISDISTALTENSFFDSYFNLSGNELGKYGMFTFKLVLLILFVSIVIGCFTAPFTQEQFSNDYIFSDKDTINPNYSNYQSTALTPPTTPEGNPSNLLFGQANRTVISNPDGTMSLFFEIFCDLFVLNGNPFGEANTIQDLKPTPQKYLVILKNTSSVMQLGELSKNSDGVYKLKYKTNDTKQIQNIVSFNEVQIVYTIAGASNLILSGKFSVA